MYTAEKKPDEREGNSCYPGGIWTIEDLVSNDTGAVAVAGVVEGDGREGEVDEGGALVAESPLNAVHFQQEPCGVPRLAQLGLQNFAKKINNNNNRSRRSMLRDCRSMATYLTRTA